MVKILNAEFALNMYDAHDARRVESALERFDTTRIELQKSASQMKMSEYIEKTCTATFECFNAIFGDGADRKIFGDQCDLLVCIDAICCLKDAVTVDQEKALSERYSAYLPNRQK